MVIKSLSIISYSEKIIHLPDNCINMMKQPGLYIYTYSASDDNLNAIDIIGSLKSHEYFLNWLDSQKINDFQFDYYLEK